jgi:hypothetical protein
MIYSAVMFALLPMVAAATGAITNPLGPYKVSDVTVVSRNILFKFLSDEIN